MKKKWTLVLMAFVFVLSMCGFAACNEKGNDTPGGAEITIGVTPSSLKLDRYEEYKLTATVMGSEETPSWSSDNTAVATVTSDGTVAAAGVGEATITAKIGDASGTCKVTVEDTLKRPKLSIGQLDTEEGAYLLALLQGETFTLEPSVSYGSDEVEDVSYTFESQNSEIAEVSAAGVVTAKSVGSVQITVKTNWKGLELTAAVNVQVKVNAAVALDRTEVSLATSDQGEEHKKTDKLNATVTYNDEDYAEAEISWSSSDPEKVTVSADGTITAAGVGEATITASVTIEGEVVAATAKVTVYKPVVDPTEEIFAEINVDGSGSYQVSYDGLLAVNDKNGDKAGEGSDGTVTLGNEFIAEQSAAWLAADGDELDVEVQYELADVIYNVTLTVSVDVYEMPLALSDIYTADNKVETNVSFGGKTGLLKYTAGKDFDNTMWGPHAYFAPKTDNGNIRKHFGKTVNGTEQGGKLILKMYIETEDVNNWQFGVYVGDHGAVFGNEGLMSGATDGLSFVFRDYETYEVLGTPDSSLANKWFILEVNLDKWTDKSTAGDRSDWLCIGILKTGTSVYIESATAVSKNYYENDYARTDYTVEYYKDGAIIDELTAKGGGRIGSSVAAPALTKDQLKDHGLETAVIDESDSVQTLELKAKDNVLKIFYTTRSVDLDAVLTDTGDLKINKNIDGKTLVRLTDGDTVITADEGDYLSVDADWVRSYQDKWLTSGGGALGVALKAYFEEEPDAAYATEIELMFETYQLSLDSLEVYDKNNAYEANVSFGGKTGLLKYTAGSTAYNDTMWGPHAYFMPRANNVYIRNVFGKSAAGQANGGKLILKMYIETADVNNWQFGMYLGAHGAVFGNAGWLSGAKDGTFTIRDYDTYEVIGTPDSSLANKWFILEADLDRWTDNKGANDRDDTLCIGIVKTGTSVYIESATAVSKDYYDNQFAQAEYTVEYYKDGTIVEALTKTLSAQIGTTVAAPELTAEELSENGMDGYLIDRESGMLTASLKASGTVLKVMYRNAIAIEGVMSAEGNRTISKSIVSGKTLKELKENGEVITEEAGDNLIVKAEWFASKKAAWFAGGDAAATAALTAVFTDGGEQDAELKYTFDTYELSLDSLEVYDKANTYEADVAFDGKTGLLKYTAVKDYDNSIWGPHAYFMPKADNGNIRKHFGKTVDGTAQGGKLLIKMYIETEDVNNWQFGMYIGNHGAVFGNAGWLSGAKDGTFTIRDYDTKEIYGVPDGSLANKWVILEVDLDRWADNNAGSGDRNEWLCIGILKTGTSVYIESAVAVSGDYFAAWAPEEA